MTELSQKSKSKQKSVVIVHCSRGGFGANIAKTVSDKLKNHGCNVQVISARKNENEQEWKENPDVVIAISPIYFRMIPRTFKQFFRHVLNSNSNETETEPTPDHCDCNSSTTKVIPIITAGRQTNGAPRRRLGRFFKSYGWETLHPGFDLSAMNRNVFPNEEIETVVNAVVTE